MAAWVMLLLLLLVLFLILILILLLLLWLSCPCPLCPPWFKSEVPPMWTPSLDWWEILLRAVVVYVFLLVLLRITGKRQVGQLAPFDLVLLLVLSNAVQNSMNGGDNSLIGGLITAVSLIVLNYLVGVATYRSKTIEAFIEGRPQVLIHDGKL